MSAQVEQMFGLRGNSLAAFKRAGDVIDAYMRKPLAPVTSVYPRIHLSKCADCAGTGKRTSARNVQYECGTCFGHGDRVRHA